MTAALFVALFVQTNSVGWETNMSQASHVRGVEVYFELLGDQHRLGKMIQRGAALHGLELVVIDDYLSF